MTGSIPRVALVLGATSSAGSALLKLLLNHKFKVITCSRTPLPTSSASIEEHIVDFFKPKLLENKLCEVVKKYHYIPYLVNCAAIMTKGEILKVSWKDFEDSIRVNVYPSFLSMQALLPRMVERNFGRIVNLTSGAPLNCFAGFATYSGSKALLNTMTVTAAKDCSRNNVKINLLSPGPIFSRINPMGPLDPEVCIPTLKYLLSKSKEVPTGRFFWMGYEIPLFPDTRSVNWLEGRASKEFRKIITPDDGTLF